MKCECGTKTTMRCGRCGTPICVGCSDWGLCRDCLRAMSKAVK